MGTRHLTIVQKNNEYKVAQYGQWDGYPEGAGSEILDFCRRHLSTEAGRNAFSEKVLKCKFIAGARIENLIRSVQQKDEYNGYDENCSPKWTKVYPQFSRDTGNEVLSLILNSENGLALEDTLSFIKESLFCEWAWVIDLDKNTFEAYVGFNKVPLTQSERFYRYDTQYINGYRACRFVKAWSLDELPTEEEFLQEFKTNDEDE